MLMIDSQNIWVNIGELSLVPYEFKFTKTEASKGGLIS